MPIVEIVEQPGRFVRMRYETEERFSDLRSIGAAASQDSNEEERCYPRVRIHHAYGSAQLIVGLVTHESLDNGLFFVHPNRIRDKNRINYPFYQINITDCDLM